MARVTLELDYDLGDDFEDDVSDKPADWEEYLAGEPIDKEFIRIRAVKVDSPLVPLEGRILLKQTESGGLWIGVNYSRPPHESEMNGPVCKVLEPLIKMLSRSADELQADEHAADLAVELQDGRREGAA
jgi:hypothetical protein